MVHWPHNFVLYDGTTECQATEKVIEAVRALTLLHQRGETVAHYPVALLDGDDAHDAQRAVQREEPASCFDESDLVLN